MARSSESELFEEDHRSVVVGDCEGLCLRRCAGDETGGGEEEEEGVEG